MRALFLPMILATLTAFGAPTQSIKTNTPETITQQNIERFALVMAQIQHFYIKPTTYNHLFDSAIRGMLQDLDPHSEFLDKNAFHALQDQATGKYGGVGLLLMPDHGVLKVISPLDDSPSARAGIQSEDLIIKINDAFIRDIGPAQAYQLLLGAPNTNVI